jgi:hypothetical protein
LGFVFDKRQQQKKKESCVTSFREEDAPKRRKNIKKKPFLLFFEKKKIKSSRFLNIICITSRILCNPPPPQGAAHVTVHIFFFSGVTNRIGRVLTDEKKKKQNFLVFLVFPNPLPTSNMPFERPPLTLCTTFTLSLSITVG